MESDAPSAERAESALVARQLGRVPRDPWRVEAHCRWGRPNVIASPPLLADGTPFPTLYWLTCPYLMERIGVLESEGAVSRWADRLAEDEALAHALAKADAALRRRRAEESGGSDACAAVGIAGQRDAAKTKCLHAHVALALAGIADPIGAQTLAVAGDACDDDRCSDLAGHRRQADPTVRGR